MAGVIMAAPAQAQRATGSAWTLPDPNGLMTQVIRRIVSQDKPGGLPIAEYRERAFGREETAAAIRAFSASRVVVAPAIFAAVNEWPVARESDALPCAAPSGGTDGAALTEAAVTSAGPAPQTPGPITLTEAAAGATGTAAAHCAFSNALWLAVTKVERGELPHELHIWYVTRFRTDVQGSVQSATYSFCERWLRVGGAWKYDGFVRMTNGVVTPTLTR
jgi:hypothetical protein